MFIFEIDKEDYPKAYSNTIAEEVVDKKEYISQKTINIEEKAKSVEAVENFCNFLRDNVCKGVL